MLLEITIYIPEEILSIASYWIYIYKLHINMNTTDYWPMAREYSIWNATVAALQFWTADLEVHMF